MLSDILKRAETLFLCHVLSQHVHLQITKISYDNSQGHAESRSVVSWCAICLWSCSDSVSARVDCQDLA